MTISVKHPVVSGRKITPADYAAEHILTGAANKWLGFDGSGNLVEKNEPTGGSGPSDWISVASYLDAGRIPFVTDDLPAFQAAIDAIAAIDLGPFTGSSRLIIPPGRYYLSDTPVTANPIYILGAGSAQTYGAATLIRMGNNKDGFNLAGTGSVLEGVQIWGGNVTVNGSGVATSYAAGDSPLGTGVKVSNDFIEVRDVMCAFFGEDGFRANATGIEQANSFVFYRCQALYNGAHGFVMYGDDANAGKTDTCSAIDNGLAGFYDASFLGNGHYNNHARGNGVIDPTGNLKPVGAASFGGVGYYVVNGQEAAASTTQPGTNESIWATYPDCPVGSLRVWVTGQTWLSAGAYMTNSANANSYNCVFVNCYAENSQVPSQVYAPAKVDGGLFNQKSPLSTAPQTISYANALGSQAFRTELDPSSRFSYLGSPYGIADNVAYGWRDTGSVVYNMTFAGAMSRGGATLYYLTANGIDLANGKSLYNNGTKVVGAQGAAVADATGGGTVDTEARAAINALLARCRAHGLIGT